MNKTIKIKQILFKVVPILLAIFFVYFFLSKLSVNERKDIISSLKQTDYFWVVLAVFISLLSIYIRALRWQLMIKTFGYKTSAHIVFFSIMSCYLTNLAIPRLGEVVRCTMLSSKYKIPFDKTLGTIITERTIDLLLFVLLFFGALFLEYDLFYDYLTTNLNIDINKYKFLLIIGLVGIVVLFFLFLILRKKLKGNNIYLKIKKFFLGIFQGMKSIIHLEKPLLFIFYSLLIWFLWIFGTWVVFKSMTECLHLNMEQAMTVTVLGNIGVMITPGGLGLYPSIFATTLNVYNINLSIGYALGWINWLVSQIGVVVLGPMGFLLFSNKNKTNKHEC